MDRPCGRGYESARCLQAPAARRRRKRVGLAKESRIIDPKAYIDEVLDRTDIFSLAITNPKLVEVKEVLERINITHFGRPKVKRPRALKAR